MCEHAYQRTRLDLLKRRFELAPVLERYGITLNVAALKDETRTLDAKLLRARPRVGQGEKLRGAALDLGDALGDLKRWMAERKSA